MSSYNLITILGPTATGKTSLAAELAYVLNTEIISADSRQVYRGMDLGTGKDIEDYIINGRCIPYHLIDIVDAGYKYNVFEFQQDFLKVFEIVSKQGKIPILSGGTGLYIDAVLKGYELINVPVDKFLRAELEDKSLEQLTEILSGMKQMHNRSDVDTKKRAIRAIEIERYYRENPKREINYPEINSLLVGINYDRDSRRQRISNRLKERLDSGMIKEVETLMASGISSDDLIYYGLEYKYLTLFVIEKISYDEMFSKLETAIHQFAKRQMTWFRGMERKGHNIHWLDGYMPQNEKLNRIMKLLGK